MDVDLVQAFEAGSWAGVEDGDGDSVDADYYVGEVGAVADSGAVEGNVNGAFAEIDRDCDLGSADVYGYGGGLACALAVGGEDGGGVLLDVRLRGLGTDLDGG